MNSIHTIAINGVNKDGSKPVYAEECAGIMATTYSKDGRENSGTVVSKDHLIACESEIAPLSYLSFFFPILWIFWLKLKPISTNSFLHR